MSSSTGRRSRSNPSFEPTGMSLLMDLSDQPTQVLDMDAMRRAEEAIAAKQREIEQHRAHHQSHHQSHGHHHPGGHQADANHDDQGRFYYRAPPETLNGAAQQWMQHMPVAVRPILTARRYPHVVNRLARHWHHPRDLAAVFEDLLVSSRPGRKGFPPEVLDELIVLLDSVQGARESGSKPGY